MTTVDDVHDAEGALDLVGSHLLAEQEAAEERLHAARYRALRREKTSWTRRKNCCGEQRPSSRIGSVV